MYRLYTVDVMRLFATGNVEFARAAARLAHVNPFLPARIEAEREALGGQFDASPMVWTPEGTADDPLTERPNLVRLRELAWDNALGARRRLDKPRVEVDRGQLRLYEDLCLFALYGRVDRALYDLGVCQPGRWRQPVGCWPQFAEDFRELLQPPGHRMPSGYRAEHVFACFFQIRRAFHHIFHFILGSSMPAAELRSQVWQSVFTHDLRRWQRSLFDRMGDVPTLVTGPTGSGKELVARAVALSRHVRFDPRAEAFTETSEGVWRPVNLAALPATLIESELFGHVRGAFTGAVRDRSGRLDRCPAHGAVFLDEIGELSPEVQVKLLRVLEDRTFSRVGEADPRIFEGKLIAATHRDLAASMEAGAFRPDLYYRLNADHIRTPTLSSRLADDPTELLRLTRYLAGRLLGDGPDADAVADETVRHIGASPALGPDYPWPGNVRELEQCVRNVLIRREYLPPGGSDASGPGAAAGGHAGISAGPFDQAQWTADELLDRYCAHVYARTGSWSEAARRLGLDRRTVKARTIRAESGAHPGAIER